MLLALSAIGLFFALTRVDMSDSDTAAKVTAGVVAVVGVLFTGTVGFVGVLLKQSLDARNLEIQREAETRLTLEAGIKALQLMDESSQAPTPSTKISGAILIIAELGLLDSAISLVHSLWPLGKVDTASAISVIDAGLSHSKVDIQRSAAALLDRHVDLIAASRTESAAPWPQRLTDAWSPNLDISARERILTAMARYLLARPYTETSQSVISGMMLGFSRALEDPNEFIRADAALCLVPLLHHFRASEGIVDSAGVGHFFADVRAKHADLSKKGIIKLATNNFQLLALRIDEWFQARD
jgi:hypothetical protein